MDEETNGLDAGSGFTTETPEIASPEVEEAYSSAFFNGETFLQGVPEQHRGIVKQYLEPVMKGWDGGLTEKFNKHKEELGKWTTLGDLEQVQRANEFFNHFRTNGPQALGQVIMALRERYGDQFPALMQQILQVKDPTMSDMSQNGQEWDYSQGEPDPNDVFRQNVTNELEELRKWREEREQADAYSAAEKQFDNTMQAMHTSRPDIPEKFIVMGLASGQDTNQIAAIWDELRQQNVGSQNQETRRNPPPVMGGQGGIPSGQVDVSKLDAKGRRALGIQWLEAAQNQ